MQGRHTPPNGAGDEAVVPKPEGWPQVGVEPALKLKPLAEDAGWPKAPPELAPNVRPEG